jgi:hypothetical protein
MRSRSRGRHGQGGEPIPVRAAQSLEQIVSPDGDPADPELVVSRSALAQPDRPQRVPSNEPDLLLATVTRVGQIIGEIQSDVGQLVLDRDHHVVT